MEDKPVLIDRTRTAEGYLFATHRDRCLYLGRANRDRPRWLEQNPHAWVRISDIQKEAETSPPVPVKGEDDVKAALSSRLPSSKARNVGEKDGDIPSANIPAAQPLHPNQPSTATSVIISAACAPSELMVDGRRYVSSQRLTAMLGISPRTLSRRCSGRNGPPKIRIGGKAYFELDQIPEWRTHREAR